MGIEEETWKGISEHIPLKIIQDIRKDLKAKEIATDTGNGATETKKIEQRKT